jgi:hypothetical protein
MKQCGFVEILARELHRSTQMNELHTRQQLVEKSVNGSEKRDCCDLHCRVDCSSYLCRCWKQIDKPFGRIESTAVLSIVDNFHSPLCNRNNYIHSYNCFQFICRCCLWNCKWYNFDSNWYDEGLREKLHCFCFSNNHLSIFKIKKLFSHPPHIF